MMRVEMSSRSATCQRYSAGGVLRMVGEIGRGVDRLRFGVAGREVDRAGGGGVEDLPLPVDVVEQRVVTHVLGERRHRGDVAIVGVAVMERRLHVARTSTFGQVL